MPAASIPVKITATGTARATQTERGRSFSGRTCR